MFGVTEQVLHLDENTKNKENHSLPYLVGGHGLKPQIILLLIKTKTIIKCDQIQCKPPKSKQHSKILSGKSLVGFVVVRVLFTLTVYCFTNWYNIHKDIDSIYNYTC